MKNITDFEFPILVEYDERFQAFNSNRWDAEKWDWDYVPNRNYWKNLLTCLYPDFLLSEDWNEARNNIKSIKALFPVACYIAKESYTKWKEKNNLR